MFARLDDADAFQALRIEDGDLIVVAVGDRDHFAVGRDGDAAGRRADLRLADHLPCFDIDLIDMRRVEIGDIEKEAGRIDGDAERVLADRDLAADFARRRVDHRDIGPFRARHIGGASIGRHGDAGGLAVDRDRRHELMRRKIEHAHGVRILIGDEGLVRRCAERRQTRAIERPIAAPRKRERLGEAQFVASEDSTFFFSAARPAR